MLLPVLESSMGLLGLGLGVASLDIDRLLSNNITVGIFSAKIQQNIDNICSKTKTKRMYSNTGIEFLPQTQIF